MASDAINLNAGKECAKAIGINKRQHRNVSPTKWRVCPVVSLSAKISVLRFSTAGILLPLNFVARVFVLL